MTWHAVMSAQNSILPPAQHVSQAVWRAEPLSPAKKLGDTLTHPGNASLRVLSATELGDRGLRSMTLDEMVHTACDSVGQSSTCFTDELGNAGHCMSLYLPGKK